MSVNIHWLLATWSGAHYKEGNEPLKVTIYDDEVIEVFCNEITIPIEDSTLNALLGKGICQPEGVWNHSEIHSLGNSDQLRRESLDMIIKTMRLPRYLGTYSKVDILGFSLSCRSANKLVKESSYLHLLKK